jgi:hypothetical protein
MRAILLFAMLVVPCIAQVDLGPRTYIGSHTWKTTTKTIAILQPATSDSGLLNFQVTRAANVVRVSCHTIGSGSTATINLNKRSESAPGTSGTDILSAGLVCDDNSQTSCAAGCDVNTITSPSLSARQLVSLTISALSGNPQAVTVHVEITEQ